MNPRSHPNTTTADGSPPPARWRRRSLVLGVLVAGALAIGALAMTAGGSPGAPTILNTEKVERAIEQSSLNQRGEYVQVSCPAGVHQRKGLEFSCTAVFARGATPCCTRGKRCCPTPTENGATRFVVSQLDAAGHVHYEAP
jgi:hypothetical protein